jgi:chloramphenicol O-acetyltransferase
MIQKIKFPKGSKPLFKSQKDYEKFREEYIKEVAPEMEKHRIARAKSEHEARFRRVDNSCPII